MADRNAPTIESPSAQTSTATSRLPSWLQRMGSRLKDIVRPEALPAPAPSEPARPAPGATQETRQEEPKKTSGARPKEPAASSSRDGLLPSEEKQRALRAQMREKLKALEERTPARPPAKGKARPANVHETLGPKTMKDLLAGDLHPNKLQTVFSKLEKAGLGHLAEAGSRPAMPAMPARSASVATTASRDTVSSKGSGTSRAGAASAMTSIGSTASTPTGPNEVRSRETVSTSREGVEKAVTSERSPMDERPRGRGR